MSTTLADVNADGNLDAVTANFDDDRIAVLLGLGDGTFGNATDMSTLTTNFFNGFGPTAVVIEDVTGDGVLDVVVANARSRPGLGDLSIFAGNGAGTFQAADYVAVMGGVSPTAIIAVDLLGIGGRQIVTANQGSNNISVFATLGPFALYENLPAGSFPQSLAAGEFN